MRGLKILAAVAAGVVGLAVSSSQAAFVEQFETMAASTVGTPPGAALPLSSGNWFVLNNSSPIGITGVSQLPTVAGGTTPFAVNPGDGTFYASMNFNNGAGVATINTFLETPVLTLHNGDTLSFITRAPSISFPDRLIVKISQNGAATDEASFSTTLLTINPNLSTTVAGGAYPTAWTSFTATVSGLSGATSGRLAFNYNVTNGGPSGANSNLIGLDRVNFSDVPEPATLSLLAGAGVFFARRRRTA